MVQSLFKTSWTLDMNNFKPIFDISYLCKLANTIVFRNSWMRTIFSRLIWFQSWLWTKAELADNLRKRSNRILADSFSFFSSFWYHWPWLIRMDHLSNMGARGTILCWFHPLPLKMELPPKRGLLCWSFMFLFIELARGFRSVINFGRKQSLALYLGFLLVWFLDLAALFLCCVFSCL